MGVTGGRSSTPALGPLHTFKNGLQKVPPSVRPSAGGALHSGDGNERRHHAAGEVAGQSAAGHGGGRRTRLRQPERKRAADEREGRREGAPPRVRRNQNSSG